MSAYTETYKLKTYMGVWVGKKKREVEKRERKKQIKMEARYYIQQQSCIIKKQYISKTIQV